MPNENTGANEVKIVVVISKSANAATICTMWQIVDYFYTFSRRSLREFPQEYLEKVGPKGLNIVERVLKIDDVTEIHIVQNEVRVDVAKNIDPSSVSNDVISIICNVYETDLESVQITYEDL